MSVPESKVSAWLHAHQLRFQLWRVCRSRVRALTAAGERAARNASGDPAKPVVAAMDDFRLSAEASLREDRADYGQAADWTRWLIVARGLFVRAVFRAKERKLARAAEPQLLALGEAVAAGKLKLPKADEKIARNAAEVEAAYQAIASDLTACLTKFSGRLYPPLVAGVGREIAGIARSIGGEAASRTIPKLPALAGLVAGYWVTRSFTTSRFSGFLSKLGLYRGEQRFVDGETYERLQFWAPLIAAGICSYLGSRVVKAVQAKYAPVSAAPALGDSATVVEPVIRRS